MLKVKRITATTMPYLVGEKLIIMMSIIPVDAEVIMVDGKIIAKGIIGDVPGEEIIEEELEWLEPTIFEKYDNPVLIIGALEYRFEDMENYEPILGNAIIVENTDTVYVKYQNAEFIKKPLSMKLERIK